MRRTTDYYYNVGVNRGNLGRVCRENKGTVGGFHWEYV